MDPTQTSNVTRIIVVVAIILIGGGALAYSILGKKVVAPVTTTATSTPTDTAATSSTSASSNTTTVVTTTTTTTSTYKDGTYSATGSYLSPGGDEKIGVQLTLANDIVTAATVTPEPVSGEGRRYQEAFQSGFSSQVIGKNIADINLTRVSGSSLTPQGFNDAVAQIEVKAKA